MYLLFFTDIILYLEVLYKLFTHSNFYVSNILIIFYALIVASIISLLSDLLPKIIYKPIYRIFSLILAFWYGACIIVKKTFDITLSINATTMADQFTGGGFMKTTIDVIKDNLHVVGLVLIPYILTILFTIFFRPKKKPLKMIIVKPIIIILSFVLFISSLLIFNPDNTKSLYFDQKDNNKNCEYFGVLPALLIDIRKDLTGFEEKIVIDEYEEEEIVEEEIEIFSHKINIDFDSLIKNETRSEVVNLHNFIKSETITTSNEYTGIFEGKNLIYIMAEAFDGIAVTEELTPTLYKLINEGFYFSNYYSVTNLSTIGGEFQELTGLIPNLSRLTYDWREYKGSGNYYPYGLGTLFKNLGYSTYAYHDHNYDFQDRNVYLKALGFDNYMGCGNGLEDKGVTCYLNSGEFPESDDEMILGTYEDYINDEHFMVYYATVSGHMGWGFGDNAMSIKHQDEVMDLPYSTTIKAYIAAQMELDLALEDLLKVLEENGRLEDTVIVLAADHHPYGLEYSQMEELASVTNTTIDETFELYHNNLIIYNPSIEHTEIDKPCSTIDVLPTTLNLFNIEYDSRIIIGKDIMSSCKALVSFSDSSWISDYGRYNANTSTFINDNTNQNLDETKYISLTNNLVRNRIWASNKIMEYNYYNIIFNQN